MQVAQAESGKVDIGQEVRIKFDNYPYYDFGDVLARVESLSLIPRQNQYLVLVNFPGGLHTSYSKELEFRQEMQGQAEIIVARERLVSRVLNWLSRFS